MLESGMVEASSRFSMIASIRFCALNSLSSLSGDVAPGPAVTFSNLLDLLILDGNTLPSLSFLLEVLPFIVTTLGGAITVPEDGQKLSPDGANKVVGCQQ